MSIKAIETTYKGYRFRSRLEARWAVFFDHVGIEWKYEPEGFDLGELGKYLPDFFLPDLRLWVEIKPGPEDEVAETKIATVASMTGKLGTVQYGDPYENVIPDIYSRPSSWIMNLEGQDGQYCFCVCPECGKVGFEFDGRGGRICAHPGVAEKSYSAHHPRIVGAARYARSVRFEHGENPCP